MEGLAWNLRLWERKKGRKKYIYWRLTTTLPCTYNDYQDENNTTLSILLWKMVFDSWKAPHSAPKKMSASHLLVHAWYASTIFVFLIIFIFIKRLNYPSIKLIITKKQSWNTKRSLSVSLKFFTLTRNIVISLCNQSIKRPKIPWIQVIYIYILCF